MKKKKKKKIIGVTFGGPTPGVEFVVDTSKKAHIVLLPNDPHYLAAIYMYTSKFTALNEIVAIFSHYIERPKE